MVFIRVTSGEPKNGVYEFHDHGFKTEAEALAFKAMAEEDGTYWGMWSAPAETLPIICIRGHEHNSSHSAKGCEEMPDAE